MKLQNAIKQLVAQFGQDIVSEGRFANLLADLNGYGDDPVIKQVFKECLKAGYGKKLFDAYKQDPKNIFNKSIDLSKEYSKESKFKEDLVSYGFDCILYGLGCLTNVNEPLSEGSDLFSKANGQILGNLGNMLSSYQKQYLDLLNRLVTLPEDILRDAPGYYSTEALDKLYAVEAKIAVLLQELGKSDFDWCKKQRDAKLSHYQKQKADSVKVALDKLKKKYSELLSTSIIVPKKLFIKRSGYYAEEILRQLSILEQDIELAYYNMSISYDDWCLKEKDRHLVEYKVESKSIILQFLGKIGVPAVILLGALGTGVSYISSSSFIEQFENTIQLGELSASNGDYGKALQLFSEAKAGYDASFRPSHYRDIADEHIRTNLDKVTTECTTLIKQSKFMDASTLLEALPQNIVIENEVNAEKVRTAWIALNTAMEQGLDNLISNISKNKGHLDATAKECLNELLKVNPDDYWLSFIKNREK